MAISDTEKLDFLWKKVIWGTSKTAGSTIKGGSNETVPSALPVYLSNIWAQTDTGSIPAVAPNSTTSTVQLYTGAQRIRATSDPTAPSNVTWFATTTYNDTASRVGDFIPTTFGSSYLVKVWIGDPATGNAARIFPDTTNEEYVFDYVSGTLNFTGTIPSGKAATIGTGTFSVASNGIYFEVFRYVGKKGSGGASSLVVADIAARNALTPSAGDRVHVLDASGIPTDAKAGEYADYVYDGTQWVLVATQDSARSDSLTTKVVVTPEADNSISLGYVGNGARVVEVSIEVTEAFDGDFAVSVGDAADNDRLMANDQNDLQEEGAFVTQPIYQFPTNGETEISIYITGSATVGSATVIVTYA